MELILNILWALLTTTGLAWCFLTRSHIKGAPGRLLLTLTVLFCVLFPAVSITDDLWVLHNPAETDTLVRRNDGAVHHQSHQLPDAPTFLISRFEPVACLVQSYESFLPEDSTSHEASVEFRHIIRPPPVL